MTHSVSWALPDEAATLELGAALARATESRRAWVALNGPLGAGKSTLVRGVLQAMGWHGPVPSPTYTLVEPYELSRCVWHLDLYRLGDESEWDELGVDDAQPDLLLIEWPERITGLADRFDLQIDLAYAQGGRTVTVRPGSVDGHTIVELLRGEFKLNT